MTQSRGVLYLQWGDRHARFVQRSVASLRALHPTLPVHVHTFPSHATLLDKSQMFDLSSFDETLYLDADTVVLDRLDFGFEQAQRFGLACCICECPRARRFNGLSGELIEYNTGVLFFTRAVKSFFDAWKYWSVNLDSSMLTFDAGNNMVRMPLNDQGGFAKAVAATHFNPAILPLNWNFRPGWHGPFFSSAQNLARLCRPTGRSLSNQPPAIRRAEADRGFQAEVTASGEAAEERTSSRTRAL